MMQTTKQILYIKNAQGKKWEERLKMGFSMSQFSAKILLSSLNNKMLLKNLRKSIFLKMHGRDFRKRILKKS